jgi:hypothetical protein
MDNRNDSYIVQELADLVQQSRLRAAQITTGPIWIALMGKKSLA